MVSFLQQNSWALFHSPTHVSMLLFPLLLLRLMYTYMLTIMIQQQHWRQTWVSLLQSVLQQHQYNTNALFPQATFTFLTDLSHLAFITFTCTDTKKTFSFLRPLSPISTTYVSLEPKGAICALDKLLLLHYSEQTRRQSTLEEKEDGVKFIKMSWNGTHHSSNSGDHKGIGQTLTVHNHTGGDQHHSSPSSSLSHASKLFDSKKSHQLSPAVVNSSTKDSLLVFLTLAFISVTLYFTFFLWKKHREKPLATLYKLEEYRYSRLSQNEMEVDNVIFYGDALQAEASQQSDEDEECKPATLQVETDSLISTSNGKTNITLPCTTDPSTAATTKNGTQHVQPPKQASSIQSSAFLMSAHGNLLQDSDEDLLQ